LLRVGIGAHISELHKGESGVVLITTLVWLSVSRVVKRFASMFFPRSLFLSLYTSHPSSPPPTPHTSFYIPVMCIPSSHQSSPTGCPAYRRALAAQRKAGTGEDPSGVAAGTYVEVVIADVPQGVAAAVVQRVATSVQVCQTDSYLVFYFPEMF
jgi:hypothetical protein